jgi:hypothetical protein
MLKMFGVTDVYSRFAYRDGEADHISGRGLFEVGIIGPHAQYGFTDFMDTAP